MMIAHSAIASAIRQRALELGFDAVGFSPAEPLHHDGLRLSEWLKNGHQADMGYMANHFEKRIDPTLLVDGAKTVISLIHNYYPSKTPINTNGPVIARYAYGLDYHDVLKDKLQQLFLFIKAELFDGLEGRVFTDSAPVLERAWAQRAGLGWIGKNSNLINPKIGSYFFIAELIVNLPLPETSITIKDYCGGCTKCIDACPTQAIIAPRVVDANKCISYLTIENKGDIFEAFEGQFENRIFGCDICQEVCPWNRKAQPHNEPLFEPKEALMAMQPSDWEGLTQEQFSMLFKGSAVKRAKYSGLVRNIRFVTKT
jgi:epoxyqueuosine reductase